MVDEDGDPVVVCGSVARYVDVSDDDDDEDEGTLFVDVEDCEPGKYWMMDAGNIDVPMACH